MIFYYMVKKAVVFGGYSMDYSWIDGYCLAKAGAEKDYKAEWDAVRYMVKGKMFLMHGGDRDGKEIFTFKLEPEFGALMRSAHQEIVPGYYMNKEHWNSMYTYGSVPRDEVMQMLDRSYHLILGSLSKKQREEVLGGAAGGVKDV